MPFSKRKATFNLQDLTPRRRARINPGSPIVLVRRSSTEAPVQDLHSQSSGSYTPDVPQTPPQSHSSSRTLSEGLPSSGTLPGEQPADEDVQGDVSSPYPDRDLPSSPPTIVVALHPFSVRNPTPDQADSTSQPPSSPSFRPSPERVETDDDWSSGVTASSDPIVPLGAGVVLDEFASSSDDQTSCTLQSASTDHETDPIGLMGESRRASLRDRRTGCTRETESEHPTTVDGSRREQAESSSSALL